MRPKLLLHICCAPDATVGIEELSESYDVDGFFYNPNIHPDTEYDRRLASARHLASIVDLELLEGPYNDDVWFDAARGLEAEPEKGKRCEICFQLRIDVAARTAAEMGYAAVATVLTTSPHKDAARINEIGHEAAAKHGLEYISTDLKKRDGFRRSVQLSRQYNLYRQNYCGCIFSLTRNGT